MNTLEISNISVTMRRGRTEFTALAPTSLKLAAGESLAVTGRSGSGKTTLANVILGLLVPDSGSVNVQGKLWVDSTSIPHRSQRRLVQSVPQDAQASFVPRWTIRQSLEHTAQRLRPDADAKTLIARAIDRANFDASLLERRPHQISGGQAQRAAIARALVPEPAVIVADEPTSALDSATAATVIDSLLALTRTSSTCLLAVTHDPTFASQCDATLTLATSGNSH